VSPPDDARVCGNCESRFQGKDASQCPACGFTGPHIPQAEYEAAQRPDFVAPSVMAARNEAARAAEERRRAERRRVITWGVAIVGGIALIIALMVAIDRGNDLVVHNESGQSLPFDVDWRNEPYVSTFDGDCEGTVASGGTKRCEHVKSGIARHVPVSVKMTHVIVRWQWQGDWLSHSCSAGVGSITIHGSTASCT
jgi:hypothetical protein